MTAAAAARDIQTGQIWRSKRNPERRVQVGNLTYDWGEPEGWDWRVRNLATGHSSAIFAFNLIRLYDLETP